MRRRRMLRNHSPHMQSVTCSPAHAVRQRLRHAITLATQLPPSRVRQPWLAECAAYGAMASSVNTRLRISVIQPDIYQEAFSQLLATGSDAVVGDVAHSTRRLAIRWNGSCALRTGTAALRSGPAAKYQIRTEHVLSDTQTHTHMQPGTIWCSIFCLSTHCVQTKTTVYPALFLCPDPTICQCACPSQAISALRFCRAALHSINMRALRSPGRGRIDNNYQPLGTA